MPDHPFAPEPETVRTIDTGTTMLSGFGNHFATEAVPGALPVGRNSPQHVPFGLYTEQLSGTAFTAPRSENRRSWLYRLRPTASHPAYRKYGRDTALRSAPFDEVPPSPNRMRWDPAPLPAGDVDFVDGLKTYGGNGDAGTCTGIAVHGYAATVSMRNRAFGNADGELLVIPQQGAIDIITELSSSLRTEADPALCATLNNLYHFFTREMSAALDHGDPARIHAILPLLRDLRNTWAQALKISDQAQPIPVAA